MNPRQAEGPLRLCSLRKRRMPSEKGQQLTETVRLSTNYSEDELPDVVKAFLHPKAVGSCGANIETWKTKCPEILRSNPNRANEVILRRRGLISILDSWRACASCAPKHG